MRNQLPVCDRFTDHAGVHLLAIQREAYGQGVKAQIIDDPRSARAGLSN